MRVQATPCGQAARHNPQRRLQLDGVTVSEVCIEDVLVRLRGLWDDVCRKSGMTKGSRDDWSRNPVVYNLKPCPHMSNRTARNLKRTAALCAPHHTPTDTHGLENNGQGAGASHLWYRGLVRNGQRGNANELR